jgi:hypothetical protein
LTDTSSVDQAATAAFSALKAKARVDHGGNTQALLVVYAVESFLRRLAISDYADLWVTSRLHRLDAAELRKHIFAVAEHRRQPVIRMAEALANLPHRQGPYAAMVARMSYLSPPPPRWSELLGGVIGVVDPLVTDTRASFSHWDPATLTWMVH